MAQRFVPMLKRLTWAVTFLGVVLIAVNRYAEWPNLQYPVSDAKQIKDVLLQRYFVNEVVELYDTEATKENIMRTFIELQQRVDTHDSLSIYYSGHGHLDEYSDSAFWIPVDGGKNELVKQNWIPNAVVRGMIAKMKSMHICVMSDSCFSGSLLEASKGKPMTVDHEYFRKAYGRISRQVLTAGALGPVPARSEFAQLLRMSLEKNTSRYLNMGMICEDIKFGMRETMPMLGELKFTGHQEGASFLLFLKGDVPPPPPPARPTRRASRGRNGSSICGPVDVARPDSVPCRGDEPTDSFYSVYSETRRADRSSCLRVRLGGRCDMPCDPGCESTALRLRSITSIMCNRHAQSPSVSRFRENG